MEPIKTIHGEELVRRLRGIIDIPDPLPSKCHTVTLRIPCHGSPQITYECHAREVATEKPEVTNG